MANVTRLVFDNEHGFRVARDIHLDQLERKGWKPSPHLDMLIVDEDIGEMRQKLSEAGIEYREEAPAIPQCE